MISVCKADNYSLPHHLLFCVLGFVFKSVRSVITFVKCWLGTDFTKTLLLF